MLILNHQNILFSFEITPPHFKIAPNKPLATFWINPEIKTSNACTYNCKFSKYGTSSYNLNDPSKFDWPETCVTLNPIAFASSTRPWKWEAHLSLYLPYRCLPKTMKYVSKTLTKYLPIFTCCENRPKFSDMLQSTRPTITAYITEKLTYFFKFRHYLNSYFICISPVSCLYFGKATKNIESLFMRCF